MTTNVEQFAVGVAEYFFWARKSGAYPYGASGTITNGSDAGMLRHKGLASAALTFPAVPREAILGDGGKIGEFIGRVIENVDASVTFNVFDLPFDVALDGRTIFADGDFDAVIYSSECTQFAEMCTVYNTRAKSFATGSLGEDRWAVFELWNYNAQPNLPALDGTAFTAQPVQYTMTIDSTDTELTGVTVSNPNYGVTKGSVKMYWSENPVTFHTFIGDGVTLAFTLDYSAAADNANKVKAWIDGAPQTYTTDFAAATTSGTTTVTFVSAPAAGEVVIVRYEFLATC